MILAVGALWTAIRPRFEVRWWGHFIPTAHGGPSSRLAIEARVSRVAIALAGIAARIPI